MSGRTLLVPRCIAKLAGGFANPRPSFTVSDFRPHSLLVERDQDAIDGG